MVMPWDSSMSENPRSTISSIIVSPSEWRLLFQQVEKASMGWRLSSREKVEAVCELKSCASISLRQVQVPRKRIFFVTARRDDSPEGRACGGTIETRVGPSLAAVVRDDPVGARAMVGGSRRVDCGFWQQGPGATVGLRDRARAAAYGNKPSPVFAERINHAVELHRSGVVKRILFHAGGLPRPINPRARSGGPTRWPPACPPPTS